MKTCVLNVRMKVCRNALRLKACWRVSCGGTEDLEVSVRNMEMVRLDVHEL